MNVALHGKFVAHSFAAHGDVCLGSLSAFLIAAFVDVQINTYLALHDQMERQLCVPRGHGLDSLFAFLGSLFFFLEERA